MQQKTTAYKNGCFFCLLRNKEHTMPWFSPLAGQPKHMALKNSRLLFFCLQQLLLAAIFYFFF